MTHPGLYPDLNEAWSDADEDGTGAGDDGDPSESLGLYANTTTGTETAPSYDRYRGHASPASSARQRSAAANDDAVGLTDYRRQRGGSDRCVPQDTPSLRYHHLIQRDPNSPDFPDLFGSRKKNAPLQRNTTSVSSLVAKIGTRAWNLAERTVRWSVKASLWQKALLTIFLGLMCSVLFTALREQLNNTSKDNYLPCTSSVQSNLPPCIPHSDLKRAKVAAFKMREILNDRAAQYICGLGDVSTLSLSLSQLQQQHALKGVSSNDLKNVFYLIIVNTHWNLRWMDKENKTVSDWTRSPHSSDLLTSLSPSLPLKCTLLLWLAKLWNFIQWIVLVLVSAVVVYAAVALYRRKKRRQQSAVFTLVSRIIDVMKYHYKKSCSKKDLLPYLAIIHVRDMLIPPSERKVKEHLWSEAVHWIACHESRLRVETRRIAGEDFEVWRWIQEDPPPTEIPSSSQQPSSSSRNQGNWDGSVFDHYPPEITTKVAPPTGTPSLCIRLKNMFEPIKKMAESQCRELENAVLERCHPHGAVVHIWVDKKSPVGCVYLKMDSLKSAMGAYNALHGGWYKGKLVTAKYIPEAKYHKWFPTAVTAKTPHSPS